MLPEEFDDVPRKLVGSIDLGGTRRDALLRDGAHEIADLALLGRELLPPARHRRTGSTRLALIIVSPIIAIPTTCCQGFGEPAMTTMTPDPIGGAPRQWFAHGGEQPLASMPAVTSIMRPQQILLTRLNLTL